MPALDRYEIAALAADIVEKRGLNKDGGLAASPADDAPVCLIGALCVAAFGVADYDGASENEPEFMEAVGEVRALLPESADLGIADWNDRDTTTVHDVARVLRRAAAKPARGVDQ